MNLLTSKKSWLVAPIVAFICLAALVLVWALLEPSDCIAFVDNDGCSPLELMTLPLFALIIPLVWLCPPNAGGIQRQVRWSALWSLLALMALVREQDWHKMLFAHIWPAIDASFSGTVFKMRFLKASDIPLMPKLFVVFFFIIFFATVIIPLIRYAGPILKGFLKLDVPAWTAATFGAVSLFVLVIDRIPAHLRKAGIVNLKDGAHEAALALFKVLEEGGEMTMALLALLLILQAHFLYGRKESL